MEVKKQWVIKEWGSKGKLADMLRLSGAQKLRENMETELGKRI